MTMISDNIMGPIMLAILAFLIKIIEVMSKERAENMNKVHEL